MTGEQKIQYIAKQIAACKKGRQNVINCPYCDAQNVEPNPLCCDLFAAAVAAIFIRGWDQERAEQTERILEKVQAN